MKKFFLISILFLLAPFIVSAHASPTSYSPAANAVLEEAPSRVQIQFTERIEPDASSITVLDKDGNRADSRDAIVDSANPRMFSVGLGSLGQGTYTVSWQVVSADDGHFTKGAYVFSVGEAGSAGVVPQFEVIYRSTTKEGLATSLELIGLALILGYAVLSRYFPVPAWIRSMALAFVFIGAASYLGIKTFDLAAAQAINISEALQKFAVATAGQMAIARMAAAIALSLPFVWKRKVISTLVIAALFWARVRSSHAAAAEFMPAFTMLNHLVHLLAKSLWAGLLLVLAFSGIKMDQKISKLLSWAIALAAITGAYIVWLDLKDVGNILLTDWGHRFVILSLIGGLLVAMRLWNHFISGNRFLRVEAAAGVMLMLATGFIMITTPPTINKNLFEKTADSQGTRITLREHAYEKDQILLTISGSSAQIKNMVVTLSEEEKGIGPAVAAVSKRSGYSFVFPKADLSVPGKWKIEVTAQKDEGYDATASFNIDYPNELEHSRLSSAHRVFDGLALLCLIFALAGLAAALAMFFTKPVEAAGPVRIPWILPAIGAAGIYIFMSLIGPLVLKSDFQKLCEENYDMWHVMTPIRGGRVVSQAAVPGCMLADGSFHFGDYEEYKNFITPVDVKVDLKTEPQITAHIDTNLEFSIVDSSAELPVTDFVVTHENLVHAIIVSSNFQDFQHVHPELIRPGHFVLKYHFFQSGKYLIALDFRIRNEAKTARFTVEVRGSDYKPLDLDLAREKEFAGYDVALNMPEKVSVGDLPFKYSIKKDGKAITDLEPYLGAAMHIAVVKDDLSEFIHTHGELTSNLSKTHIHALPPARFGPEIFSAVNFSTPGTYFIFAEFKHQGQVVVTRFAVQAE